MIKWILLALAVVVLSYHVGYQAQVFYNHNPAYWNCANERTTDG